MILLSLALIVIYAQDYNTYSLEIVKTFPQGQSDGEIGYREDRHGSENGPTAILFNPKKNQFIVLDVQNYRISFFNDSWNFVRNVEMGTISGTDIYYENNSFVSYGSYYTAVFNDDFELIYKIIPPQSNMMTSNYIHLNNLAFGYDKNHNLYMWDDIGKTVDNDWENRITDKEKITNIIQGKADTNIDITSENLIFDDNELKTRNFIDFANYWNKQNNKNNRPINISNLNIDQHDLLNWGVNFTYLGNDIQGNYYWSQSNTAIIIFNKLGQLLDITVVPVGLTFIMPTLHPSGDIYFLKCETDKISLLKIPKQW